MDLRVPRVYKELRVSRGLLVFKVKMEM